jgi:hypothetical protein
MRAARRVYAQTIFCCRAPARNLCRSVCSNERRFVSRSTEVREVLFNPVNKNLLVLLRSDKALWDNIDKILQIERDVM